MVGEQHQILLSVNVKRGQQTKRVLRVLLLLEDSTEVFDLRRDCAILVESVVDFVLAAGADLHWGVVLLVTIKAGQVARYCLISTIPLASNTRCCGGNQHKTRARPISLLSFLSETIRSPRPDRAVIFPHAPAPRGGLAAVDVESRHVGSSVSLRAALVSVLENLNS